MKLYASITKTEAQEDGTLKVYGFASSGAVDSDGETVSPDAIKAAIPDYMKFGAVREMHQSIAAGTAIDIGVDDDGKTNFAAHIVDPVAVKKVSTGTYKGFSIGGKVLKRDASNPKNITELRLVEVSLVDRPANPDAVFTMYKAEKTPEEIAAAEAEVEKSAITDIASLINAKAITPSRVLKAARQVIEEALKTPEKRKPVALEPFKKGMSGVACFAQVLCNAAYLTSDAAYEAEYEGDASKIPEELRAWVAAGVSIFNAMAAEESAELIASIKQVPAVDVAVIASAEQTADLGKKGATFSAGTKAKLADLHKSMLACCDKMDALGYKDADDDASSAASAPDTKATKVDEPAPVVEQPVVKAATTPQAAYNAELAKDLTRGGPADQAAAAALLEQLDPQLLKTELAKRDSAIDDLVKRLTAIEAQPAPDKVILRTVSKTEDSGGNDAAISDEKKAEILVNATPEQMAKAQIIKEFRSGGRRIA